jgi:hypothetical protein
MLTVIRKTGVFACFLILSLLLGPSSTTAAAEPRDDALKQHLIDFLGGGNQPGLASSSRALSPLRSYPVTATTAYLLLENDPALLRKLYPEISGMVMPLFAEANVVAGGLVKGMPGASQEPPEVLSPGFNALAALELYSLHLIAWKTGAYEDALEFLAWSNSLADLVTRSFYDPARACFFPIDGKGRLVTTYCGPGQLLPLVTDRSLGPAARARVAEEYRVRCANPPQVRQKSIKRADPWDNPLMQQTMLDILGGAIPPDGDLYQSLRASAGLAIPAAGQERSAWIEYWRDNRFVPGHLFPRWRSISSLVNLTLLFEREGLVQPKELAALRGAVDSLAAGLSSETMTLDAYKAFTGTVNRLLSRIARFSDLLDQPKERWRAFDNVKWLRLSPRIKRLVKDGLASSRSELSDAKVELSGRLERERGLVFRIALPERPIPAGRAVQFTVSLQALRDTLVASQLYLQIGGNRWKMMESAKVVTLTPGGPPLLYEGSMALPPTLEPGIVTLHPSIDFLHEGGRIEIDRVESIALTKQFDVTLELPEGRRIKSKSVPVEISISYRGDRDIQGTVEGTFLREFATSPPLPSRFLVSKDSARTDLRLTVGPKGVIAPGRYPFSLTVTLDATPVALFEETLVRPLRWLHLGTLMKSDEAVGNALTYQTDLLKAYATSDGRSLRWNEAPPGATDSEGFLWPQRLYGEHPGRCMLLYTIADAPERMKLVWKLATKNTVSLWVNSELLASGGDPQAGEITGPVELRKGTNSFLIAVCWDASPDRILFELSDENGLPPTGLGNELEAIVDGYERLAAAESEEKKKKEAPAEQTKDIVFRYTNRNATEVSVIGSFNNWEPGATPMRKEGKGEWTAHVHLRAGKYPYKFLVNKRQKIVDPANTALEPDGFGGNNSVLEVH